MTIEQLKEAQAAMPDAELIEMAQSYLSKLCKDPRSFRMTVPVQITDTDMVFGELIRRFRKLTQNETTTPKD